MHIERGDNMDEDLPDRIVNPHMYTIYQQTYPVFDIFGNTRSVLPFQVSSDGLNYLCFSWFLGSL